MKRIAILLFVFISSLSAYCQTNLQDGDRCFDNGEYSCALTNYNESFKQASGKDKQIAEIKLTRAKWCADHIKIANQAFANKDYKVAKENYENVLESNPKDSYAQEQLFKCNNILNPPATTLSVSKDNFSFSSSGGSESISVNTNANSYSVNLLPTWCSLQKYVGYFIVTCSANFGSTTRTDYFTVTAGDQTVRLNLSQSGAAKNQKTSLSVAKQDLSFSSSGGESEKIIVSSNAGTFSISLIPSWFSVQTDNGYFTVYCTSNSSSRSRSDWFKVKAGDKEVKIHVNQSAANNSSEANTLKNPIKNGKCFNCPKAKDTWGITAGYVQKYFYHLEGFQLGLRVEPLFKYGFGFNTGLNFEGYSTDLLSLLHGDDTFEEYALNIPLHLEYRLNFSKWFNIFAYGGPGLNVVTNTLFEDYSLPTTLEYGGGLRINHMQFNIGQSLYFGNLKDIQNFGSYSELYQDLILSVSYMF